jgi:hypothetical protein
LLSEYLGALRRWRDVVTYLVVSILVFLAPLLVAAGVILALIGAGAFCGLLLESEPRPAPRLSRPAVLRESHGFQIIGFSPRHR